MREGTNRRGWLLATLLVAVGGCATASRWQADDRPSPALAAILLSEDDRALQHRFEAEMVPEIPVRKRLRPCCAFGSELRVSLGPIPLPGIQVLNVTGADQLGPHTYDSGILMFPKRDPGDRLVNNERNGLVYTCRGGFIDVAHVRDYVDWGAHLFSMIAPRVEEGGEFALPDEGGRRRVVVKAVSSEVRDRFGFEAIVLWLAQWTAWRMSIWHEIATWYGWSAVPGFSERASAFSPEDSYSNLLGARMLAPLVFHASGAEERLYNLNVGRWLHAILELLGPVPAPLGRDVAKALDGHWWDSTKRLPSNELVRRRFTDVGPELTPWLAPPQVLDAELSARLELHCGKDPQPLTVGANDVIEEDVRLSELVHLEIEVEQQILRQDPFTELGATITDADFGVIIDEIEVQMRAELGPGVLLRD